MKKLIHNQFRPSNDHPTQTVGSNVPIQQVTLESNSQENLPGCVPCCRCYVCTLEFLTPCDSFTSYHTTQVFSITKHISRQDKGLIYLADCITCESNTVGYSIHNLPNRFSNHKSHIKRYVKSCRLTKHFIEKDHDLVSDKTQKEFDQSHSKHIRIKIIDTVDLDPKLSSREREKLCEEREGYWQH